VTDAERPQILSDALLLADRKSALYFRTYRRPLDKPAKCVLQVMIELVPAVIADFFAKQAGAYSKFNLLVHSISALSPLITCYSVIIFFPDQYSPATGSHHITTELTEKDFGLF